MRRRAFIRNIGAAVGGVGILSSSASAQRRFTLPNRLTDSDDWAFESATGGENHTFEWVSQFGYNQASRSSLKQKGSIDVPINSIYAVWLNQIRVDNSSPNCKPVPFSQIGCIPVNPKKWAKSWFSDSPAGEQAKKLTKNNLEDRFGFSDIDSDSGLNPHGLLSREMDYNEPGMDIISKNTNTAEIKNSETNDLGADLPLRTFLVVKTPNDGKSYLAVARTIPDGDSVDLAGITTGDAKFVPSDVGSHARSDMKGTKIQA